MKSPKHPKPSGDRRIARLLIEALRLTGHVVETMSELRTWEGKGDSSAQSKIVNSAEIEVTRILSEIGHRSDSYKPNLWFTYHLYHKAPDLIGSRVARFLNIPYIVAEASYSAKQQNGPWGIGLKNTIEALEQAAAVICLNPEDVPALESLPSCKGKIHRILPFIESFDIGAYPKKNTKMDLAKIYKMDPDQPWLVTVAMMRRDAKLISYQHLAACLKLIAQPYKLVIVGDGVARREIEAMFSTANAVNVFYTGELDQCATMQVLNACDVFVWPACNEAIGMAVLEAQSCALPMVVGNSGAIPEIVEEGETGFTHAPDDICAMATSIERFLQSETMRRKFSVAAIKKFKRDHTLDAAAKELDKILQSVV